MRSLMKRLINILFLFALLASQTIQAVAQSQLDDAIYIVSETENGVIIDASREKEVIPVGGLSKVLSLYIIYDALEKDIILETDKINVSPEAYELSQDYSIDNVPLRPDGDYTVKELLGPATLSQANGIIYALAETIAGSEEQFVNMMNQQLLEWGITDCQIYNVTGLPDDFIPNQSNTLKGKVNEMSAEALTVVSYQLLNRFPEVLEITKKDRETFRAGSNDAFDYHNSLIQHGYFYPLDIDGLFIQQSNVGEDIYLSGIVTYNNGDLRTINVLLNFPSESFESSGLELIQKNERAYTIEQIAEAGDSVTHIDAIALQNDSDIIVPVVYSDDYLITVPREDIAPQLIYTFEPDYEYFTTQKQLIPPIEDGTVIGNINVEVLSPGTNMIKELTHLPSATGNRLAVEVDQTFEQTDTSKNHNGFTETVQNSWGAVRRFFINLFN